MKRFIFPVMMLLGLTEASQQAFAAVTCSALASTAIKTDNISPSASYTGNDLPVGSTIYRLKMHLNQSYGINCDGPYNLKSYLGVTTEPLGSPTIMNTSQGSGPVYPTNVPGVGVFVWSSYTGGGIDTLFSKASPMEYAPFNLSTAGNKTFGPTVDVSLVKTGNIPSGSVVDATKFPTIQWYIPSTSGYSGLPANLMRVTFTGSLHFITQTCTTPDVNVDLGSYDVTKFTAKGTTTPWRNASIVMQNCPAFTGFYSGGATALQTLSDSGTPAETSRYANIFTVSLTPANAVSGNIISVDSGANAATGVGVQMGYSTTVDAAATPPENIWTAGTSWDLPAPTDGRKTVNIPLAARYYQTGNTITPGKANTKMTVNIDYK
ncbi:fimbrial protein [Enterobacter sp. CC120223-11]|uniref:fimbrial protein n=1 Tax=Enterobacter sp. CC120223-11 TaxID=1378073 RepID=UPI000BC6718F|nr:fimbrial protein [Enterobacter sp. CC120223-11]SNY80313.1 Pilin (type 1 fimbria component protein) [Enterobacter sp. CC120223-11]